MIGRWFGNRDHTTVLHAVRTVAEKAEGDRGLADQMKRLGERINNAEAALIVGAWAPPPEEPAAPPPVTVTLTPSPVTDAPSARRVLDAVRGYIESRRDLAEAEHTRGEFGARRRVEAEYALLDRAWRDYAAGRDRS